MHGSDHPILPFSLGMLCLAFVLAVVNVSQKAIEYINRPEPVVVQVDHELEKVYAELGPRLRGVRDRVVPAAQARAIVETIVHTAREHGFSPWFIVAIIEVESRANIDAVSPSGARGLMQVLPSTFASVSDHHSVSDPVENVKAGIAYLGKLYKGGKGFIRLDSILRAYNGGPKVAMVYSSAVKAGVDPLTVASNEVHTYPSLVRAKYTALLKAQGHDPRNIHKLWRIAA